MGWVEGQLLDLAGIRTMVAQCPVYAGYLVDARAKDLDPDAPRRPAAREPMISDALS